MDEKTLKLIETPGAILEGSIASLHPQFSYGYVALRADPESQFMLSTAKYPDIVIGMPVLFELDEGKAVKFIGRDRAAEAQMAAAASQAPQLVAKAKQSSLSM